MKGIVIKSFVNKDTKTYLTVGESVEFSDERFKELQKNGFVKPIEEPSSKVEKKA